MLSRLLELKEFCTELSKRDPGLNKVSLTAESWDEVAEIVQVLLPSKICAKKLQSEQLTPGDFYGSWLSCKLHTEKFNTRLSNVILQNMKNREKLLLDNPVLAAAVFLDPRYKVMLTKEQTENAINHLIKLSGHLSVIADKSLTSITDESSSTSLSTSEEVDEVESFLKQNETSNKSEPRKIETVLVTYDKNQSRISRKADVLEFWKSQQHTQPELFCLAMIVLAVPVTQVSVERLFFWFKIFTVAITNSNKRRYSG